MWSVKYEYLDEKNEWITVHGPLFSIKEHAIEYAKSILDSDKIICMLTILGPGYYR